MPGHAPATFCVSRVHTEYTHFLINSSIMLHISKWRPLLLIFYITFTNSRAKDFSRKSWVPIYGTQCPDVSWFIGIPLNPDFITFVFMQKLTSTKLFLVKGCSACCKTHCLSNLYSNTIANRLTYCVRIILIICRNTEDDLQKAHRQSVVQIHVLWKVLFWGELFWIPCIRILYWSPFIVISHY